MPASIVERHQFMNCNNLTLKLDSSYNPIEIINWQDAITLVITGKAYVIETYERIVRSAREKWKVPAVIVLKKFVRRGYSSFSCTRKNVFIRDDNTCQYCHKVFKSENLTLDHVLPRSKGGDRTWDNIVAACRPCNQKKGDKFLHKVGMIPLNRPAPPDRKFLIKFLNSKLSIDVKNYI